MHTRDVDVTVNKSTYKEHTTSHARRESISNRSIQNAAMECFSVRHFYLPLTARSLRLLVWQVTFTDTNSSPQPLADSDPLRRPPGQKKVLVQFVWFIVYSDCLFRSGCYINGNITVSWYFLCEFMTVVLFCKFEIENRKRSKRRLWFIWKNMFIQ